MSDIGLVARPIGLGAERQRPLARVGVLRVGVSALLAGVVALQAWAITLGYGLRVTSDMPTYLALLRDLAVDPLAPASPFLATPGVETSHATPWLQLLAWTWDWLAPAHDTAGAPLPDPAAAGRLLGIAGIGVTLLLLHALFVWVRGQAGSRTAWLSIPALLCLFGPAHVIWAGDLTFHGLLYAGFYPQTLAVGLLLYTLAALELGSVRRRALLVTLGVAATMVVHPFTGLILICLLAADGTRRAGAGRAHGLFGAPIVAGYLVAEAWPAYSLRDALELAGADGLILVTVAACAPAAAALARRLGLRLPRLAAPTGIERVVLPLAVVGLLVCAALAAWTVVLVNEPNTDPLLRANRLALYWVEDRWRWVLMLAGGLSGVVGLVRLVGRDRPLPILWLGGLLAVAFGGIAGLPLPVWWRFLLFAQVPLALGVAVVLARSTRAAQLTLGLTLALLFGFKLVTLVGSSDRVTYFGNALQPAYGLGSVIPPGAGLVAADPFTAYYVPGASGHRVLSVTKAHVGSPAELAASERGYRLLHRYYAGAGWWQAAQSMWRLGVRYVVVEKSTSLAPRTLAEFSTGPTPLVRTPADRRRLGAYFYRNNRVGTVVHDSDSYVVYRLERSKLWP